MAETLAAISLISFIASGIFMAVAVLVWFIFGIPSVIGDLSGATARKSIERMRSSNEVNKVRVYQFSTENPIKTPKNADATSPLTEGDEPSAHENNFATEQLVDNDSTMPLTDDNATEIITNSEKDDYEERKTTGIKFTMLDEVMIIHTDEVIE